MLSTNISHFRFSLARRTWGSLAALLLSSSFISPAHAETLKEALTAAYLYNPTLKSARAQLRATDNQVSIAKSGYRPTITATFLDGFEDTRTKVRNNLTGVLPVCQGPLAFDGTCPSGATPLPLSTIGGGGGLNGTYNPRSAQIALQQNIFDGFRTYNAVKGTEAQVESGREDLRSAEENVLLNAATAYMDIVRDQAIVNVRQNNVRVLSEQLRATRDRFRVGEVTRTDVAQAESGLAQSQADLSIAQGTLYGDQARFAQFIGHPPGTLRDPGPPAKLLPKTRQAAIDIAQAENPGILAAIFRERAQQHQVKQVKGQLLPTLSLSASYTKSAQVGGPEVLEQDDTRVFGQLTVPLYQAGAVSAQIRQAIEILSRRRQEIDEQRELARQNVSSQWGLIVAAKGNVRAGKSAVEATKTALQGVREEERVGQRTILDVLNSEQQHLNAQVNLVSFRRDPVVASYGVLAAMGRLTAYDIALQAERY
ncbi:MAG: TolC family outer membrane protein, partial [Rhodomicrobium sp.]|nr:TolC family outer membrane protein [Rhodomicrobium sp.]